MYSQLFFSINKFRYDSNRISGTVMDHFPQGWRNNDLVSGKLGYIHNKRLQNIAVDETLPKKKKLKLDKSSFDRRMITAEEYKNEFLIQACVNNHNNHNKCRLYYLECRACYSYIQV